MMEMPRRIDRWGILSVVGFAVPMHREIFLRKFPKTY